MSFAWGAAAAAPPEVDVPFVVGFVREAEPKTLAEEAKAEEVCGTLPVEEKMLCVVGCTRPRPGKRPGTAPATAEEPVEEAGREMGRCMAPIDAERPFPAARLLVLPTASSYLGVTSPGPGAPPAIVSVPLAFTIPRPGIIGVLMRELVDAFPLAWPKGKTPDRELEEVLGREEAPPLRPLKEPAQLLV